MYLRGSKWNMRRRQPRINWFLVILVVILIAVVTYVDRFILPTAQTPFMPTPTATRDPESYVTEAQGDFSNGKLDDAINAYLEAIRITPKDPSIYIALARVQIFDGKYADALVNAENSLLLNPNSSMAQALRGWALTEQGNYTAADDSLKNALRLDPNNGQAHAYEAFLYGKMTENSSGPYVNPIETAKDESRTATSMAPDNLEAHWARAYIYQLTGNQELAVQEYLAAININKNISELHLELGVTYKALGVIDQAIQQYTLAITLDPTNYLPELYSSRALASIGQFTQAEQYASAAVQDAPNDPYVIGNWGYMLYKLNDWPSAIRELSLTINGGQTADGKTVQALPPSNNDPWISTYYYTYALVLAQSNLCSQALPLTQTIMDAFRQNDIAVYNAQYAQNFCAKNIGTASPQGTASPKASATPRMTPTP
jgi:tetratricopeptide (TPR) repeat protein